MSRDQAATRNADDIARRFGELLDEGQTLLSEALGKPARSKAAALRDSVDDVTDMLSGFQSSATRAAREGVKRGASYARQADQYLHDNPWPAIAGGVVLGILATMLWTRRD